MPPKQRITREMILERSFAMFCREGMEAVNARSVAKALNCSTQPIFSYFAGMDDLKGALDEKAREVFEAACAAMPTEGDPLEAKCLTYVRFASEQSCLFRHLFLSRESEQRHLIASDEQIDALAAAESERENLPKDAAREICVSLWAYAHGLAAIQASGKHEFPVEQMGEMIASVREGLVLRARRAD